jgi:phenylacetate-CoA ligase
MTESLSLEGVRQVLVGRLLFSMTNELFNRRGILSLHRSLLRSEWQSPEALRELQLRRVRAMVAYALLEIPYYGRRFREAGLERGDIDSLEDLSLLPTLDRQDVIESCHDMVARRYADSLAAADATTRGLGEPIPFARFRRHRLIRNTSSGSTGTPTRFYDDGSTTALSWAHELRMKSWYGLDPGVREARMARVSVDYVATSRAVRLRRSLWGQLVLPGINVSVNDLRTNLERILEFKPRVLWGVTTGLTGLAELARTTYGAALPHRPELVVAWAAPLYEHERALLENVFHCPVASIYGTREVGHVAATCPEGSFHVNQESYYVESLGGPDGAGELVVTTLQPAPMPFIRYRVGDLGVLGDDQCGCGRGLQVLGDLVGRTGDVFVTLDGRTIAPNYWCRVFMSDEAGRGVEQFQIVYESDRTARVRIVRRPAYTDATEETLRRTIARGFGDALEVTFDYVPAIPPAPNGKYQLVVNRARTGAGRTGRGPAPTGTASRLPVR